MCPLILGIWAAMFGLLSVALAAFLDPPNWLWAFISGWLMASCAALLMIVDTQKRAWLARFLSHRSYRQLYAAVVLWPLRWLWRRVARPVPHGAWPLRYTLTPSLFDAALLIAFVYPIAVLIGPWLVVGMDVTLGGEILQPGTATWYEIWPERAVVLGQIAILIAGFWLRNLAKSSRRRVFEEVADWILIAALAVAVAVAVAFALAAASTLAVALALAAASTLAFAFAFAFALAFAYAFAVALAFAFAFAFAVAVAFDWMWGKGWHRRARALLVLAWASAVITVARVADLSALGEAERLFILFLAVLPMLNALFDTLSYAVTLALLRWGVRSRHPAAGVLAGLLDLAFALVLFALLTAAVTALVAGMNRISGGLWLDLDGLLVGLKTAPSEHLWVFLMIGSTLLPTLLHLLAALLAVQSWTPMRGLAVRLIERSAEDHVATLVSPLVAGFCLIFPLGLGAGLGAAALWLGATPLLAAGQWYVDQLIALASSIAG